MTALPPNVVVRNRLDPQHDGYSIADGRAMAALSAAEDRHFWHLSRNAFIADRLGRLSIRPPARVLELGCGGGCVASHLSRLGYRVTGVDGHLPRILEAAARAPDARFVVEDLARRDGLADERGADAVGLFDVIEHLDHPEALLGRAVDLVRAGGWVVGTVPAIMALWSEADARAGHRVRYGRRRLESLLRSVGGVDRVETVPFNRLLVPLLWLQRRALARGAPDERLLRVPWQPVNRSMYLLLRAEHRLGLPHPRLPGASLWFALRREA